jgi:phage gp36-like protein
MADYCTADDIVDAYGQDQLDKVSRPIGSKVSDPAVVQRGITSASSIIDAYIGNRYTLPVAVVAPILTECAIDIAIYKMALGTTVRTPEMRLRYDDALALLTKIAAGTVSIGLSSGDLATNGDTDTVKQGMGKSIRTYRI